MYEKFIICITHLFFFSLFRHISNYFWSLYEFFHKQILLFYGIARKPPCILNCGVTSKQIDTFYCGKLFYFDVSQIFNILSAEPMVKWKLYLINDSTGRRTFVYCLLKSTQSHLKKYCLMFNLWP